MLNKKLLINSIIFICVIPLFFTKCVFFRLNESPIIDSLFILEEYGLSVYDTVHIVCSAYDPDQDPLEYSWSCEQGGTIIISNNDTSTIIANDTLLDIHCTVTDALGKATTKNLQLYFDRNSTPIIDSLYVIEKPEYANIGDQLHLVCDAYHSNGASLEYIWSSSSGVLNANKEQAILEVSEYSSINVTCMVIDNYDCVTERTITFNIPSELKVNGVLKANHSQSDSLLGNVLFGLENIYYLWESGIKTTPKGTFSFTLNKPIEDLTFQMPGYYVNFPNYIEKDISISDLEQFDNNEYELEICLDIPSTNNFYEYMPLVVGNKWSFNAGQGWFDEVQTRLIDGTEVWEIIDIDEGGDTLILDVSYDGIEFVTYYYSSDTTWYGEYHSTKQYKLYKQNQFIFYDKTINSQGYEGHLPIGKAVFQNGLQYKFENLADSIEYERPIISDPEANHLQLEMRYSQYQAQYGIGPSSIILDHYENSQYFMRLKSYDFDE